MQVIPVLDIRQGQAVRAVAGDRAHYGPLQSVLHEGTDPVALAKAGRDAWNLPDLYLADLDAILGEEAPNVELYHALSELGLTLWIDAGVRDASDVPRLIEAGVDRVIVGLETVRGPDALTEILAEFGPNRIVFSLDLHEGRPMIDTRPGWSTDQAQEIRSNIIDIGVTRIIELDLARVGKNQGAGVIRGPRDRTAEWLVGGGISSLEEMQSLFRAGYQGLLIGSALHQGVFTKKDLESLT
jgi:phosphoribosylformimino-5-aminoimidazole carboxamide ribotide isomerase